MNAKVNRRGFIAAGAMLGAGLATGASAQAMDNSTEVEGEIAGSVTRNVSAFRTLDWRPYFANTRNGVILCDLQSRAAHFWSEDLTRRGATEVIEKVVNPTWRPTASMRERNPEWPEMIPGGDPGNPLGPLALYLGWPAYRIHGTHDTRKIGRRSSNGCVGLYNEHIRELFDLAKVGTQVVLL